MTERDMERRKMVALEKIADALMDIDRVLRKFYIYDPDSCKKYIKPEDLVESTNDIPDDH